MASEEPAVSTDKHNNHSSNNNKTLGSLLHYFEGMVMAVELKTGKIYLGTLIAAEADLSVTLSDVAVLPSLGFRPRSTASSAATTTAPTTATAAAAAATAPSPPPPPPLLHHVVQIRGSQVRYLHFLNDDDSNTDLAAVVQRGVDRERRAAHKYARGIRK